MPRNTSKPKTTRSETPRVQAYLATLPAGARRALEQLRKAIQAAAPGAVDAISYGLPAFKLEGRILVCYRAAKDHCSLHPMSAQVIRTHAAKLRAYGTSKGTIRFEPGKPLSPAIVRLVIRARLAELHGLK